MQRIKITFLIIVLFTLPGLIVSETVHGQGADERMANYTASVEAGFFWFSQNDVRIPDAGGTDFDMLNLITSNPAPYIRLSLIATFNERHTFRALFAPLQKIGAGMLDETVFFEETTFSADTPTDGLYRFNTYRLTYRYTFYDQNYWKLGAGAAGLIRDAKIELTQRDRSDSNTDLGFVPLLHMYAERQLGTRLSFALDAEGLASPGQQGRAIDAALLMTLKLMDNWDLTAGYRVLEGGVDVDEVYNFSWINFASIGLKATL